MREKRKGGKRALALAKLQGKGEIVRNILKTSSLTSETGMESAIGSSDADAQTLAVESTRYVAIIVSSQPAMCLNPFVKKYFIKGIKVGAIKG